MRMALAGQRLFDGGGREGVRGCHLLFFMDYLEKIPFLPETDIRSIAIRPFLF